MKFDLGRMFFGIGLGFVLMAIAERMLGEPRFLGLFFIGIMSLILSFIGEFEVEEK